MPAMKVLIPVGLKGEPRSMYGMSHSMHACMHA